MIVAILWKHRELHLWSAVLYHMTRGDCLSFPSLVYTAELWCWLCCSSSSLAATSEDVTGETLML